MTQPTAQVLPQANYPLTTKRLSLRPVRLTDLDAIYTYRSMPDVARYLPHKPHERSDTQATLERMIREGESATPGSWLDLAVELSDGTVVGEVVLKWNAEDTSSGEVGFAFHPSVHGTGIATEAVRAAVELAFNEFGWRRIVGICVAANTASAALMRRIGMRQEAIYRDVEFSKGAWQSDRHFALLRTEWELAKTRDIAASQLFNDERALDSLVTQFFAAFTRHKNEPVPLEPRLQGLFAAEATVTQTNQAPQSATDFISPRKALLNGPELLSFVEYEAESRTLVTQDSAIRFSTYKKEGLRNGEPFQGWGLKVFHFVRNSSGWTISKLDWSDE